MAEQVKYRITAQRQNLGANEQRIQKYGGNMEWCNSSEPALDVQASPSIRISGEGLDGSLANDEAADDEKQIYTDPTHAREHQWPGGGKLSPIGVDYHVIADHE